MMDSGAAFFVGLVVVVFGALAWMAWHFDQHSQERYRRRRLERLLNKLEPRAQWCVLLTYSYENGWLNIYKPAIYHVCATWEQDGRPRYWKAEEKEFGMPIEWTANNFVSSWRRNGTWWSGAWCHVKSIPERAQEMIDELAQLCPSAKWEIASVPGALRLVGISARFEDGRRWEDEVSEETFPMLESEQVLSMALATK
jgi:hypothetical protein